MQPRPLVALSLALLAGLSWLADARPLPTVGPAEAARWEGQAVRVSGWVTEVQAADGGLRFRLRADGAALDVRAPATPVVPGDWVDADGRLARLSGGLVLLAGEVTASRRPGPTTVGLDDLCEDPQRWLGLPLLIPGAVVGNQLTAAQTTLTLGPGPWPPSDPTGVLVYGPACLCYLLQPWP